MRSIVRKQISFMKCKNIGLFIDSEKVKRYTFITKWCEPYSFEIEMVPEQVLVVTLLHV